MEAHSRVIVCVDDEKYNAYGYYTTDPTFDNNINKEYYNHALLTFDSGQISRNMMNLISKLIYCLTMQIEKSIK